MGIILNAAQGLTVSGPAGSWRELPALPKRLAFRTASGGAREQGGDRGLGVHAGREFCWQHRDRRQAAGLVPG